MKKADILETGLKVIGIILLPFCLNQLMIMIYSIDLLLNSNYQNSHSYAMFLVASTISFFLQLSFILLFLVSPRIFIPKTWKQNENEELLFPSLDIQSILRMAIIIIGLFSVCWNIPVYLYDLSKLFDTKPNDTYLDELGFIAKLIKILFALSLLLFSNKLSAFFSGKK